MRQVVLIVALAGAMGPAGCVGPAHVSLPTSDGGVVDADLYGSGDRGIVLAHGGQFEKSSWAKQAQALAKAGLGYVWIEPGTITMGCAHEDAECRDDETPFRVSLSAGFWMARTEVTVEAFQRFVTDAKYETTAEKEGFGGVLAETGWENKNQATWRSPGFAQAGVHPVVLVSWDDATAFCEWAGGRLPTEVEWEYSARGGGEGTRYVWGDAAIPIVDGRKQANVADESASGVSVPAFESDYDDGFAHTSPVGTFGPNGFGLHDMAGNVLEWCADGAGLDRRMARGGAWNNPPHFVRVSRRSRFPARAALNILGFRCVRDLAPVREEPDRALLARQSRTILSEVSPDIDSFPLLFSGR